MKLPQIPLYKKYSLILNAVFAGGLLGLLYAFISDAGSGYEYLRFLPGTIIGISIGFIVITFEKSLINLSRYSFVTAMVLKALIYSLNILIFLLIFVVIFA